MSIFTRLLARAMENDARDSRLVRTRTAPCPTVHPEALALAENQFQHLITVWFQQKASPEQRDQGQAWNHIQTFFTDHLALENRDGRFDQDLYESSC
jgi:hypothetical protein